MPDPDFDFMEDFTRQSLRAQPPRPAPASLERRVQARLGSVPRRSSFPRSLAVALSVVAAIAFVAFPTLAARHGGTDSVVDLLAGRFDGIAALQSVWIGLAEVIKGTRDALPDSWLILGLTVLAAAYAALAGLGTAAYRLFFQRPGRKAWAAHA
jgi:hypothetical protein